MFSLEACVQCGIFPQGDLFPDVDGFDLEVGHGVV